jgi:hypothetical protein
MLHWTVALYSQRALRADPLKTPLATPRVFLHLIICRHPATCYNTTVENGLVWRHLPTRHIALCHAGYRMLATHCWARQALECASRSIVERGLSKSVTLCYFWQFMHKALHRESENQSGSPCLENLLYMCNSYICIVLIISTTHILSKIKWIRNMLNSITESSSKYRITRWVHMIFSILEISDIRLQLQMWISVHKSFVTRDTVKEMVTLCKKLSVCCGLIELKYVKWVQ